jgi:hypothetical protein
MPDFLTCQACIQDSVSRPLLALYHLMAQGLKPGAFTRCGSAACNLYSPPPSVAHTSIPMSRTFPVISSTRSNCPLP